MYMLVQTRTKHFDKICMTTGFELTISCRMRCSSDRCTTSIDPTNLFYVV